MEQKILLNLEILVKQMAKTMEQNKEIGNAIKSIPPVDFTLLIEKLNEVADRLDKEFPTIPEYPAFPEIKIPPYPKFPDIPKVDLTEVKQLLNGIKGILSQQEKPDMRELTVISSLLNKLIDAVNSQKKENLITKIETKTGITEEQFNEVINLLKNIKDKPYGGGGGYKQVSVENKLAKQINPATEDTLSKIREDIVPLQELTETLNELVARLNVLTGMASHTQSALRIIPLSSVSTAVTGSLTAVTTVGALTNFGTGYPAYIVAMAQSNLTATLANINNVTA